MSIQLETLQNARDDAQRYLRFVEKCDHTWGILGVATVVCVVILLAFHFSNSDGLSPTAWVVGGVLGWVGIVGGLKAFGWLLRTLTRNRIAGYEKAIEELQREQ